MLHLLSRVAVRNPVARGAIAGGLGFATSVAVANAPVYSLKAPPVPCKVKLALCQMIGGDNKAENMKVAEAAVRKAASQGAQLVSLPEIWNGPYAVPKFREYAEEVPANMASLCAEKSPSVLLMSRLAKELGIYLIGGSISEVGADGKVYNTSVVFDPAGEIVCKHRKMHLFDIDIPGKMTFKESDTLSPGNSTTIFDTPYGRVGVGICYDIRFPQLANIYRSEGAHLIVYPGNFNMTTGPAHWELLQRGRAVDNQLWIATASQARNPEGGYQSYGHSMVVSPWGVVAAATGDESDVVFAEIDLGEVEPIRKQVPISYQKRNDLYTTVEWRD